MAFILLQRNPFETRRYFSWTKLKYSILFSMPFQIAMIFFYFSDRPKSAWPIIEGPTSGKNQGLFSSLCYIIIFEQLPGFLLGLRTQNVILHSSICFRRRWDVHCKWLYRQPHFSFIWYRNGGAVLLNQAISSLAAFIFQQ